MDPQQDQPVTVATTPRVPTPPTSNIEEVSGAAILITTGEKKVNRRVKAIDDDEPLVDTTAALPKRSKKTERATKRFMKRQQRLAQRRGPATLADLPAELFEEILSYLRVSDILQLLNVNRSIHAFITTNEASIARSIIRNRYLVLSNCFPLPQPFTSIPEHLRPALLSESRQHLLQIHKRPYQHVQPPDSEDLCTCMTCILAWNNLNLIVDLAHWQRNLSSREPIPMIERGQNPPWNQYLLARNAELVSLAMTRPLIYTLILQHHLETTISTLLRTLRGQKTVHPKRVFHLSKAEAKAGIETDAFLERSGPECHEFPFHRDNYYNLNAYVPNRKWSEREGRWVYYAQGSHERDLQWVWERFVPEVKAPTGVDESREKERVTVKGSEKAKDEQVEALAAQFREQASV